MTNKHKYLIFIYPADTDNECPAPQKGQIVTASKVKPMKQWAKENNRKIYTQKEW